MEELYRVHNRRSVLISLTIPIADLDQLEQLAYIKNVSRSALMRQLLKEALKKPVDEEKVY